MFVMGCQGSPSGSQGPTVFFEDGSPLVTNHGFDRDDLAFGQNVGLPRIGPIGDVKILVDGPTHAVTREFLQNVKPVPLGGVLDPGPQTADESSGTAELQRGSEGFFNAADEGMGRWGAFGADNQGSGRVGHVSVVPGGHVDFEKVAWFQGPVVRETVDDMFIDRVESQTRRTVELLWSRFGTQAPELGPAELLKVPGRASRNRSGNQKAQDVLGNLGSGDYSFQIGFVVDGHAESMAFFRIRVNGSQS